MPTQRNEERLQILRMLQEGKVTAEEAARLLEAVDDSGAKATVRKRFLRVHITEGSESKVNVRIPLDLARFALHYITKYAPIDSEDLSPDRIVELISEGADGKIIEIEDEDVRVEVIAE